MDFEPQSVRRRLETEHGAYTYYDLRGLQEQGLAKIDRLPYSIRVLLESVVRQSNEREITSDHIRQLGGWQAEQESRPEVPFLPARVIMQDFTGVPAVVDLAAMRSSLARLGGDPDLINPQIPVDLVIDHSVQVDFFASPEALQRNAEIEFDRNRERYEFLRWAQEAFASFRVVPPATGIVHQVNLEYLAKVVQTQQSGSDLLAYPDSLVGTDSHTTMINALGVLGWGVGGIEAEAAVLGQPMVILTPDVVGFRMSGELPEGTTATDLVLRVTQMLRSHGVVGKFVEFFGPGLSRMSLPDRATIANMAPEYGATVGFFPVDRETLRYLRMTGREAELVDLVDRYTKAQGLFRTDDAPDPEYTDVVELDLATVEASMAGPKRPQDRVPLSAMKSAFGQILSSPPEDGGFGLAHDQLDRVVEIGANGTRVTVGHGAVVIAAITSCTNTSNPTVMVGAGLLARNAVEKGLEVKPYVKTSLAPGSRVVTDYLNAAGLLEPLAELGFNVVAYGCTTCIGNSGPLPAEVVRAIGESNLVASAVLSGNRNFEGRINPHVRASYLASPPLVVAYALAGTVDIDLTTDPIGLNDEGTPVFLRDIWPSQGEILSVIDRSLSPEAFRREYANVFSGNETWSAIPVAGSSLYSWDADSTYIQEPPFFQHLTPDVDAPQDIQAARVLAFLGDSVTTDHISPAGAIPVDSPAGKYLVAHGVKPREFNSFGSRRGNDRVMTRGTFGNIRLRNRLVPEVEGGYTVYFPDGSQQSIFDAAMRYRDAGTPLVGVKAVIAESYERIHRSNLVGMGVLPLQFLPGENADDLGLVGSELFDINGLRSDLKPGGTLTVTATRQDGTQIHFQALIRIDTPIEVDYYLNGGILHTVMRRMLRQA
jgi:aconitate hydratase